MDELSWGLTTRQPLWVIFVPEKRRKEIGDIIEEMEERDREERGTGMKVKKHKKYKKKKKKKIPIYPYLLQG